MSAGRQSGRLRGGASRARDLHTKAAAAAARRKARYARNERPHVVSPGKAQHPASPVETKPQIPLNIVEPASTGSLLLPVTTASTPPPSPLYALLAGLCAVVLVAVLSTPSLRPRWLALALAPRTAAVEVMPAATVTAAVPSTVLQANLSVPQVAVIEEEAMLTSTTPGAAAPASTGQASPSTAPPSVASAPGPEGTAQTLAQPSDAAIAPAAASPAVAPDPAQSVSAQEEADETAPPASRCMLDQLPPSSLPSALSPEAFGQAIAAAALKQTTQFVVYTDKYRTLPYPMGDVPALYGVCTDVVIRAYRAVGIDLQARVHASRLGSGDVSIAHRRTFTLRRYFSSRGASIPITNFAEDYRPGDIVTYFRPQNSGSRDHIAIVAEALGPSGRPMIIHNRGWGPQIEDALFVDRITGHYRYTAAQDRLFNLSQSRLGGRSAGTVGKTLPALEAHKERVKGLRKALKARAEAKPAVKQ